MAATQTFARNIVESGQRAAERTDTSAGDTARSARFRIWRGAGTSGHLQDYSTSVSEGMVVLDAIHQIQSESATDLAVRWNCKAGKCGSCSAEINGMPRLMCMTRLSELDLSNAVTVEPMRAFPLVRDLVTDVSSNFRAKKRIRKFTPRPPDAPDGTWRIA
jgi:succinate dehydrogenase / fumarate reductase iron-sulfur subunit